MSSRSSCGKERGVAFVGEHREKSFHVRNFAAESVGDADGVGFVGFDQRGAFLGARDDVVDQHAAVDADRFSCHER